MLRIGMASLQFNSCQFVSMKFVWCNSVIRAPRHTHPFRTTLSIFSSVTSASYRTLSMAMAIYECCVVICRHSSWLCVITVFISSIEGCAILYLPFAVFFRCHNFPVFLFFFSIFFYFLRHLHSIDGKYEAPTRNRTHPAHADPVASFKETRASNKLQHAHTSTHNTCRLFFISHSHSLVPLHLARMSFECSVGSVSWKMWKIGDNIETDDERESIHHHSTYGK